MEAMKRMIRARRIAAKLTQRELAGRLSVNHSTICKWETGASNPESWRLPMIADALGCTTDDLYGRAVTLNHAAH